MGFCSLALGQTQGLVGFQSLAWGQVRGGVFFSWPFSLYSCATIVCTIITHIVFNMDFYCVAQESLEHEIPLTQPPKCRESANMTFYRSSHDLVCWRSLVYVLRQSLGVLG